MTTRNAEVERVERTERALEQAERALEQIDRWCVLLADSLVSLSTAVTHIVQQWAAERDNKSTTEVP